MGSVESTSEFENNYNLECSKLGNGEDDGNVSLSIRKSIKIVTILQNLQEP